VSASKLSDPLAIASIVQPKMVRKICVELIYGDWPSTLHHYYGSCQCTFEELEKRHDKTEKI